jgi:NAD-dependent SIR2 family protein deacetylase
MTLFVHGAGLSTAAGIPDYAGTGTTGLSVEDIKRCRIGRIRQWAKHHKYVLSCVGGAEPTDAHRTIVDYVRQHREAGIPAAIWTQNVDGLEREAIGDNSDQMDDKLPILLEMHGSLLRSVKFREVVSVRRSDLMMFGYCSSAIAYLQSFGIGLPDVTLTGMSLKYSPVAQKAANLFDELVLVGTTARISWVAELIEAFRQRGRRIRIFSFDANLFGSGIDTVAGDINETVVEAFST